MLVLVFVFSIFSGCTKTEDDETAQKEAETGDSEISEKEDDEDDEEETEKDDNSTGLPIVDEPITLTYWKPITTVALQIIESHNDSEIYKEMERRTGIKMDFISPPAGQETEQFNLMISSGDDLPDIIQHGPEYPGGPDKAIDDGVFIDLTDLVDEYAPNFKKVRESNEVIRKRTLTDKGRIRGFPSTHETPEPCWWGLVIRKDFMEDIGKDAPETIDEWYDVLVDFKESLNVKVPLIFPTNGLDWGGGFVSAWDIGPNMYVKDGDIKYGRIEPGFKEYLQTMNKWYKEGLIDQDFATRDQKSIDAMATSGEAGAWLGAWGENILNYLTLKKDDSKYDLMGVPYPSLQKGENVKYRQTDPVVNGHFTVITKNCEYPEEAIRWLDYGYSEEGALLYNWGIEGKTYEIVDGKPEFTDFMLDNPDGIPFFTLAWKWKLHHGPYLRDWSAQPMEDEAVVQASEAWTEGADDDYVIPSITQSAEESEEYSTIMADIETYTEQMILKFIMGVEPIDKFDEYVEQVKKMKIDRAIELRQAALDRYEAR